LLIVSTTSKIAKHIPHPHSSHSNRQQSKKETRKDKRKKKNDQNETSSQTSHVQIENAIKEMGSLSI